MPPRRAWRGLSDIPRGAGGGPRGRPSTVYPARFRNSPGAVTARWKPIGIQSQLRADRRLLRASLTSGLFARGSAESASECHSPTLPSDSQVPTRPLTPERKHPVAIICPMPTSHVVLVVRVPIHDVRIVPVHRPIVSACTYGGATAHATPRGTGALRWPKSRRDLPSRPMRDCRSPRRRRRRPSHNVRRMH
jgi:hypothetical protein